MNKIFWLEFHYQPGDSDTEPQAVMRIFQINDAERLIHDTGTPWHRLLPVLRLGGSECLRLLWHLRGL
jgi:hypothetical protein